jgi:hypothetical protein
MNDNKSHQFRPPLYHRAGDAGEKTKPAGDSETAKEHEKRGWEAYRRWMSTMGSRPAAERVPRDHSIYSWKGYHNWADKVRQSWKSEEG